MAARTGVSARVMTQSIHPYQYERQYEMVNITFTEVEISRLLYYNFYNTKSTTSDLEKIHKISKIFKNNTEKILYAKNHVT